MANVLVVEDNDSNLTLVTVILESLGHAVLAARDAAEGIRMAQHQSPDLVLMDIQLPGMDGLEATRRLKENPATRHIKVAALTAFAMKGDEERIRAAGCDDYIAKPIRHAEFVTKISQLLA
ncbi:MAG: response regulator [Rhodocyclaceae bacterium]|nr:response regulator [Rhodocyclaceae bacterium]